VTLLSHWVKTLAWSIFTHQNKNLAPMRVHKSKTIWFSLALVIFGALFDNFSNVQNLIDPQYYGACLIAIGIIVAVLRFITTEPIE